MKAADVPPDLADARVKARLERQLILARAKPPKLDIILDEIALRRVVGSDAVMAGLNQSLTRSRSGMAMPIMQSTDLPTSSNAKVAIA
jgi:hypothetical protein